MKVLCIFILLLTGAIISAQTPQWNWAKGVGGNKEEQLLSGGNQIRNAVQLDSSGNVYELINSTSNNTITFGPYSFTNPYSASYGNAAAYFVKYNPAGIVQWVQQLPQWPTAVGGGPVVPRSLFTDQKGYSTLIFGYRDSIRLGNMFFSDSTITLTHSGSNYAIARYDPDGNVIALKAHKSTHSGIESIQQFYNNQILALGITNTGDTLEGQPLPDRGYYFAILDSVGDVLKVKSIGYDSTTELILASGVVIGNKSVYVLIPNLYAPVIHQSAIPTGPLDAYLHKNYRMLVKFDSLLNFQWLKFMNGNLITPMAVDEHDNVFLSAYGGCTIPEDTLVYDTVSIRFPFMLPFDQYSYLGVVKIDGSGKLLWLNRFTHSSNTGGITFALCTDHLSNVYLSGRYNVLLINGIDTLSGAGNLFVAKLSKDGVYQWGQNTQRAATRSNIYGMADDGHGSVYINGAFSDPNAHITFGKDSLVCHTPVSGSPLAADAFLARLGNCSPPTPVVTASGPLAWCGSDSIALSTDPSTGYLWNGGDTGSAIIVQQSGNYSVYTYDSLGCYARSKTDIVKAYPQPVIRAAVQDALCKGSNDGHITLQTDSATGAVNYIFSPPIITTSYFAAGTYAITATDSVGCTAIDTITVKEPANALSVQTIYYPASKDTEAVAIATATGGTPGYTFNWHPGAVIVDTLKNPEAGLYTVTVLDSNGCSAIDSIVVPKITGMQNITSQQSLSIYPNPTTGSFYLETPEAAELKIYNELGTIVQQQIIQPGKSRIESNALPKGIYLIEIISSNKYSNKLIIQ